MIVTLLFRALQLSFGAIVLALSVVLINGYGLGHNPSIIDYGSFCGGAGLVITVVGIIAMFFEPVKGIVILGLDGLAAFFLLAGGIAFAVQAKVGSCTDQEFLAEHRQVYWPSTNKEYNSDNAKTIKSLFEADITSRCRMIQADIAFIWFMFACFVVTLVQSLRNKSTKQGGGAVF